LSASLDGYLLEDFNEFIIVILRISLSFETRVCPVHL